MPPWVFRKSPLREDIEYIFVDFEYSVMGVGFPLDVNWNSHFMHGVCYVSAFSASLKSIYS